MKQRITRALRIGSRINNSTDGSLIFVGSGRFSEDNSNLFWDDATNRLGIGTNTPSESLDVRDGAIRVGYETDTFDELIEFYRNGNKIGVIDNNNSNIRIQSTNGNAVQVINDGGVGFQITDSDIIDIVGSPTMSTALQALVDHNNTSNKQGGTSGEYYHLTSAQHGQIPAAALTQGSVVFAGVSGVLSEDNSNFFWDDSSNELGVGTNTPAAKLDVAGGVKVADDTDTCDATKVGTLRYNSDSNNSYCDMCMQDGAATYSWTNIVQHNW